jgi:hypothetical protein
MPTSISVPAAKLRDMLDAVMPHAGTDDTLPSLNAVQFEVRAGTLFLVATDRYTIGCARYVIPGADDAQVQDAAALLMMSEAREMRCNLGQEAGVVALTFSDDLRMDAGTGWKGTWEQAGSPKWKYPGWRPVLAGTLAEADAPFTLAAGIDPRYLARFATLDDPAWGTRFLDDEEWETVRRCEEPLMVRAVSFKDGPSIDGASSLLLARGDWFLGALMFVRNDGKQRVDGVWEQWTAALTPPQPVPASAA